MKLLVEQFDGVDVLLEEGQNGIKHYFISGPFMVTEKVNGNGRMYPKSVIEGAMQNYDTLIKEKRALGELGHPSTPNLNLDRVSHLITELYFDGPIVYGKAKILDTPNGKIAKSFLDEGIKLGVSSRGLGSIKEDRGVKVVQGDFRLATVDIVSEPSGPGCFVEAVMEGSDWVLQAGEWVPQFIEESKEELDRVSKPTISREEKEAAFVYLFERYLSKIVK